MEARGARRATRHEIGGSGAVRGAAHCARRAMHTFKGTGNEGGVRRKRAARGERRVMSEGVRGRCERGAPRAARNEGVMTKSNFREPAMLGRTG